jgi:hypothetical protein
MSVGAGLTKPGDRAIHKTRIDFLEALIVEPISSQSADLEVLDENIGSGGKRPHGCLAFWTRNIQLYGCLATIARMIVRRAQILTAIGRKERRTPLTCIIALLRPLNLDYLGSQVPQELTAPGTGENSRELQDPKPRQGCRGALDFLGTH